MVRYRRCHSSSTGFALASCVLLHALRAFVLPPLAVSGDVCLSFLVVLCYADGRSAEGSNGWRWGMIGRRAIPEGSRALGQKDHTWRMAGAAEGEYLTAGDVSHGFR